MKKVLKAITPVARKKPAKVKDKKTVISNFPVAITNEQEVKAPVVNFFKIEIEGEPISKSNSTMSRYDFKTRRPKVYVPERFLEYERKLNEAVKAFVEKFPGVLFPLFAKGPVHMCIEYYLGALRKKDLPNLPKTTCDALNGLVYADDAQICTMNLVKYYDKANPRVIITVYPIPNLSGDLSYPLPSTLIEAVPKEKKKRKKKE